MRPTSRCGLQGPRRLLASEAGFALIEVMVSAVLVIIFATATLSIIERSGQTAADTRERAVATQLAQKDQDALRLRALASLSDYHTTATTAPIGRLAYTVKSDAVWLRDASGQVSCSADSTRAEYVKLTSAVSWPGHARPVVLETYVSPGVKGLALGSMTVRLHTDAGVGTSGIGVTFRGQTVTTDANGCAVFTALAPGAGDATWSGLATIPNYVNKNGLNSVTQPVSIGSGQNSQVDQLFDRAGTIPVSFVDETGAATTWNVVSAANSGITQPASNIRLFTSGTKVSSIAANLLFPFLTAYQVYAGSCTGNAVQTWDTSAAAASTGKVVVPAGTTMPTVNSTVPNVAIWATSDGTSSGTKLNTQTLTISPYGAKMSGCPGTTITTDANGKAALDLPYGQYEVCYKVASSPNRYSHHPFNNTPPGTTLTAEKTSHEITNVSDLPATYTAAATSARFSTGTTTTSFGTVNTTPC